MRIISISVVLLLSTIAFAAGKPTSTGPIVTEYPGGVRIDARHHYAPGSEIKDEKSGKQVRSISQSQRYTALAGGAFALRARIRVRFTDGTRRTSSTHAIALAGQDGNLLTGPRTEIGHKDYSLLHHAPELGAQLQLE